ncbi:MAG: aldose epimerase family protein [Pseudomonadota bacterium]
MANLTPFGTLSDGRTVSAIHIAAGGSRATMIDYGARLVAYCLGDGPNAAVSSDIVGYEGPHRFTGPVVGPVINRIAGARAELDGQALRFEVNEGGQNTLHSGGASTHALNWDVDAADSARVAFAVALPGGAGGFPGNRRLTATYALDASGALELELTASTDRLTLINPGHHGVWNPDGRGEPSDLTLEIPAERYLPTDPDKIPTGAVAPVDGTAYDHRVPRPPDPTLDHNFCFEAAMGLRARLSGKSGRSLEVYSDAPGLQAYAGGSGGVALEPQLWPDAPHHREFPSIVLRPGEIFRQRTRFVLTG